MTPDDTPTEPPFDDLLQQIAAASNQPNPSPPVMPDYRPWVYHLPGILGAAVSGLLAYCVLFLTGEMGTALFVAVPISVGAFLGYHVRIGPLLSFAAVLVVVTSVVFSVISLNFAGIFCGITLGIVFLAPACVGVLIGAALVMVLKRSNFSQSRYLPSLLILGFPYGAGLVEKAFPMPETIAVVETNLDLHASAADLWNSLMFYEEVKHEPPWILKLALPKPIRAEGQMGQVGQVRRCIYDRGHLTKIITRRDEGRYLGFRVIEQSLHFEHDVRLKDGSFALTPAANGDSTEMTLTTRYQRLLRPTWVWEPIERHVVHTLHEHVMEGIRRDCLERTAPAIDVEPQPVSPVDPNLVSKEAPQPNRSL